VIRSSAAAVPTSVSTLRTLQSWALATAAMLGGCVMRSPESAVETPAHPGHGTHGSGVDFHAWEPASFEEAAADNKLILINVIATWCHWCHVMDEETFANPVVAALLAEHFVVIRVDSDARPDVSERYRAWGWPATAFLSPTAEPALNLRGYRNPEVFAALLRELIAEHERGELRRLEDGDGSDTDSVPVDVDLERSRELARAQLDEYFDPEAYGWGAPQKYPWPEPIEYAFVRTRFHGEAEWQRRALATLEAQRALIDPVDGGMYQYSLRSVWNRPHFEKIAMVQAGAIEAYAHAAMITGDRQWLDPAGDVARYVLGQFQHPDGGFRTSQDADLRRADGTTVDGEEFYALDQAGRRKLGTPRIDTAVYADLNGLMIHALAELYRATGDAASLAAAVRAGERLRATHQRDDGGFRHGEHDAGLTYLADQAAIGWGFVALHRVTGDPSWRDSALDVAEFMHGQLAAESGGYYAHSEDPEAVGVFAERRIPLPENALAAQFLIELHGIADGDGSIASPLLDRARATLLAVGTPEEIASRGKILGRYLVALDLLRATRFDLTLVADPTDARADALWLTALGHWEPRATFERSRPGERYPDRGAPAITLCSDKACSRPIRDPATFRAEAEAFSQAP
jgi:uncharacterized protein YyaL (SSP411 family)